MKYKTLRKLCKTLCFSLFCKDPQVIGTIFIQEFSFKMQRRAELINSSLSVPIPNVYITLIFALKTGDKVSRPLGYIYFILTGQFIFFIPATRHLHESCDDSSSCKNSVCRGTYRNRSCHCLLGMRHTALNGQIECLKSKSMYQLTFIKK